MPTKQKLFRRSFTMGGNWGAFQIVAGWWSTNHGTQPWSVSFTDHNIKQMRQIGMHPSIVFITLTV